MLKKTKKLFLYIFIETNSIYIIGTVICMYVHENTLVFIKYIIMFVGNSLYKY